MRLQQTYDRIKVPALHQSYIVTCDSSHVEQACCFNPHSGCWRTCIGEPRLHCGVWFLSRESELLRFGEHLGDVAMTRCIGII
jgi:hypothetical protein